MHKFNTILIKTILSAAFSFTVFVCSAQNRLLTYQDLQFIIQNKAPLVTDFLQKKDYQLQPAGNDELRFFTLFADTDYSDILITSNPKHTLIQLTTTDLPQIELIQKALAAYPSKNSKGSKVYRIKDGIIAAAALKENGLQANANNKAFIIELQN